MIRPPSNQKHYDEFWSEDEAFEQLPAEATAEARAAFGAKLTVAIETGDWSALRVAGASEPTKFIMRQIPGESFGKLADLQASGMGRSELVTGSAFGFHVVN